MRNRVIIRALVVMSLVMVSGCVTTSVPPVSVKHEVYLKDICMRSSVRWQWDRVSQVVTLKYREAKAKALVGSDLVLIGGERVILSEPMRRVQSAVVVPRDFQWKVIDRLRQKVSSKEGYGIPKIRKIMIDAGHGGKDPGAIGRTGAREKDIVLDLSKRLRKILKEKGFKVEMTRSRDIFISLEERTAIASRANVDLFISIHANASLVRSVHGFEVYSSKNLSFTDKIAPRRKANEALLFKNLSMRKGSRDVKRIVSDMLYTHRQAESWVLAKQVAKQASRRAKTKNRGAKKERFHVLRNTLVPAILIEVGFLTNPKEERLLKTSSYRQKMARSLAESIEDYAHGK